ncbi:hypothetical protein LCGC14_2891470 [marine sediment metagenome]|uniref:Uncharacterized protein n=1 Tax=marine sediment metagenome TaxID=412755 RepID=A0A0F8YIW5_9ZZZZ
MIRYCRRALLTVLKVPDTSLADVSEFLENHDYRWGIIREANDEKQTRFWQNFEYEKKAQRGMGFDVSLDGIINRLDQFVSDDIMGNMLGQKELALDFIGLVKNNKILIVNLANIGENRINSLGTLLLTQLLLAGLQKPLDSEKIFIIFSDEFSFYHTPAFNMLKIRFEI